MRESIFEEGELGFDDGFYSWLQLVTIGYNWLHDSDTWQYD